MSGRSNPFNEKKFYDLLELRKQAEEAAQFRGHTLGQWQTYHRESQSHANNACVKCGKEVQCISGKLLPNQIDIGGEAVAIGCLDK